MLLTGRRILFFSGFDMTYKEPTEILERSLAAVKREPGLAMASAPVGVWVASWILGILQYCSKCLLLITAGDAKSLPAPPHSLDTYLGLSPPVSHGSFRGPITSWHVFKAENQKSRENAALPSVAMAECTTPSASCLCEVSREAVQELDCPSPLVDLQSHCSCHVCWFKA